MHGTFTSKKSGAINNPNKNTTDDDIEDLEILKRQEKMLRHLILNLENQKQRLDIEEADLLNIIE